MKKRPLSPHLQIYKPQITSVLSILHRITGLLIFAGLFLLAFFLYALGSEESWKTFLNFYKQLGGGIWQWGLIFSLHYHALNGLRYLFWTKGMGFNIKAVTYSGWFIICLSVLLTSLLYIKTL